MGRDKALLPHPEGGSWLERTLRLLALLNVPITLLSRHAVHLALAQELADALALAQLETIAEPPPWEGPLLALHRLMERHPGQRLLLCPVDMPALNLRTLTQLTGSDGSDPWQIRLAHDGERLQPLLGIYPSQAGIARSLSADISRGERRLQTWLRSQTWIEVTLDAKALQNVNHPDGLR
jgi:molybdopterin-guanine dinucleotide biosynthesis protein A